jgi:branched-chain amino acid transport system permease protein
LGYKIERYKLLAFVLSAALSGLAGATKTLVLGFATLSDVQWQTSGEVVLMTLVGGVGAVLGPAACAAFIVTLQNELADKVDPWIAVAMGAIFVVCVLLFRRGLVGELSAFFSRLQAARNRKI